MAKVRTTKSRSKTAKTRKATRRETGGPGFDFEDRVAAWFALEALTGKPLPGVGGAATRIQMQTASLGWLLDDVLVTAGPEESERRLAVSCKANLQVSASGLPADFMELAWKQWLDADDKPMRRGRDALVLATRGRHPAFDAVWSDAKAWAAGEDLTFAVAQISVSTKHKKVFERLKAAGTAAGFAVTDSDVVNLIRSVEVTPFDFQLANSRDEAAAIASARTLLTENSLEAGADLWKALVVRAAAARLGSGTLEVAELRRDLLRMFDLKDFPDFETSWTHLEALSRDSEAVIQTALPSGVTLTRSAVKELADLMTANPVCIVYGDSGVGKSALAKSVLEAQFGDARRVWLNPEDLEKALLESTRRALGLGAPLLEVLGASARPENVLVIDAAEHVSPETTLRAEALIAELIKRNVNGEPPAWRVLVIGQSEAFVSGRFQAVTRSELTARIEVRALSTTEVNTALLSMPALSWLVGDDEAATALANLRTLAWVMAAAEEFQEHAMRGGVSAVAIVDALWRFWSGGQLEVQRLLMRLAERDGSFEHSFPLSQIGGEEVAALQARPAHCPLRVNTENRVEFEHDLAADWARFQRLKEMAGDVRAWAAYASNPLWNSALRMFGQWLLRETAGGRNRWDAAYEAAEALGDEAPLATDILLDALFLDPSGDVFLSDRAEMLFAENGKRLTRLLRRFEHVATVSGVRADARAEFSDLTLLLEAQFRTPIVSRWRAIVRFLATHQERVAALGSLAVASVCERWLMGVPPLLPDGAPWPFRKELAELALATGRAVQLDLAKGVGYVGDEFTRLHQAPFAAAPDLPDGVAAWALEMARRRPLDADMARKVEEHRTRRAEEHKARMESDPAYRERHSRRTEPPVFFGGRRKLPPWPLGAQGRVERHFQEAVLRSAAFQAFVRAAPAAAGEVLLACIIDDTPEEDCGQNTFGPDLGLAYDDGSQPAAFWKSQFYRFLHAKREAALGVLQQLIGFCTDRWEHGIIREGGSAPDPIVLRLPSGEERAYRGGMAVFLWPQRSWYGTGQLASALDALERWLCDLIDRGEDVASLVDDILHRFDSIAVLGVLTNVGKYRPDLFAGPLKPLLAVRGIYLGDQQRAEESRFQDMSWARDGELVFGMAKNWVLAPHRKKTLAQIASDVLVRDADVAAFLENATSSWVEPDDTKAALEFRILKAMLERANYSQATDPETGEERFELTYPKELVEAVNAFHSGKTRVRQALVLPDQVRDLLINERALDAAEAEHLAGFLEAVDGAEDVDLEEGLLRPARVAAAVALMLRAAEWAGAHADVGARAQAVIDAAKAEVDDATDMSRFRFSMDGGYLEFVAHLAMARWLATSSPETDQDVLRLLTSGDDAAASVISWLAYRNREALGPRFWRLQFLALIWAGLLLLHPRTDDDWPSTPRWRRWRKWLVTRRLVDDNATSKQIQPLEIAQRVERFEIKRWRARNAKYGRRFERQPGRRLWGGLNTHVLKIAFGWLFDSDAARRAPAEEFETRKALVQAFWAYESWRRTGSVDEEDDDDFKHPDQQIGYAVLAELARLTLASPAASAPDLWEPVFALGKRGHHSADYFLTSWFGLVDETTDAEEFIRRWRPMVAYMLERPEWTTGRHWYHSRGLLRQALGFYASRFITRSPAVVAGIGGMNELYASWSDKHLSGDDDNLAGLCGFLSSDAGAALRLDGLRWIAAAMRANPERARRRDRSASEALLRFLDVLAARHLTEISSSPDARTALLELVAEVVARQVPGALVLQDAVAGSL